jgi:hypothetical protein
LISLSFDRYIYDKEFRKQSTSAYTHYLRYVMEIMCGDQDTIKKVMNNWQEGLAAILIYQSPTVQASEIQ